MSEWSRPDRQIGMWSAASAAIVAAVYVAVGLIGMLVRPPGPAVLRQVDPFLAILEILIIVFAVMLVIMMSAICAYATPERKGASLTALAFVSCFAVVTCSVHFVSLTVGRQIDVAALPSLARQLSFDRWPTLALSLDLLAWDFFLGLSLLCAAVVFQGAKTRWVRRTMLVAGLLCLAGTAGPVSGHLNMQYLGIGGYAGALPLACALLALTFRQRRMTDRN